MSTAYPLADSLRLGEKANGAVATREFRPPLRGEWYLSGAIVAAYRAPNDLTTAYRIARLVNSPNVKGGRCPHCNGTGRNPS